MFTLSKVDDFKEILSYLNDNKVPKDAIPDLLAKKIKKEKINLADYKGVDDSKLEDEIKKIIKSKPGLNMGGYMGLVMAKFKGKVDGKRTPASF